MKRWMLLVFALPVVFAGCTSESVPKADAVLLPVTKHASHVGGQGTDGTSKRSVVHRLINTLRPDNVSPFPTRAPALKCFKNLEPAVINPLSSLPASLRQIHRRASLNVENRRRFEMRDSLSFSVDRTFRFDLNLPARPQLEFFYALDPCRYGGGAVNMTVTLTRQGRVLFEHTMTLKSEKNRLSAEPWKEVVIPLPFLGEEEIRLDVAFKAAQQGQEPDFLWAQPLISGLQKPNGGASDTNVLFVVIDAMRADTVGPARTYEELAPTMNALFEKGTSFKRAYSTSNQTRHSTLGMLTGQPPTIGGFYSGSWVTPKPLRDAFYGRKPPLLPMILGKAGYYVSTISHNRFQFESHPFGIDHGFDHVYDDRNKIDETEHLADRAIAHLERHRDDRFFLFLNFVSPHLPYRPPEAHQARIDALYQDTVDDPHLRRYLAEVSYADAQLRRVFDALERLNLQEDTLILITADHGEVFSEHHRCWSKRYKQSCHYNHGMTLFDEEIHVPLAFVWPSKVRKGQVIETPTSHIDLAPTILDLLGLPQEAKHVGRSLAPTLAGDTPRADPVYIESRTGTALIEGMMKFHTHSPKDDTRTLARMGGKAKQLGPLPRYQLYDLQKDPGETQNLALEDPSLVEVWNQKIATTRRLLASRFGSVEALSATAGPAAVNKMRLVSQGREHQLVGSISTKSGSLSCVQTRGHSTCMPLDNKRLKLSLRSGTQHPELAFTSTPRDAPLAIELTLDGESLPIDKVRFGPYGLRLLKDAQTLDRAAHLRLLTGRHGPKLRAKDELALYMWRNPAQPSAGLSAESMDSLPPILGPDELDAKEGKEALSPELEGILKDLGYTQ